MKQIFISKGRIKNPSDLDLARQNMGKQYSKMVPLLDRDLICIAYQSSHEDDSVSVGSHLFCKYRVHHAGAFGTPTMTSSNW